MKEFLQNVLAFLGLCVFGFFVVYALVYAWDFEAELQEQKEINYMYERGITNGNM